LDSKDDSHVIVERGLIFLELGVIIFSVIRIYSQNVGANVLVATARSFTKVPLRLISVTVWRRRLSLALVMIGKDDFRGNLLLSYN